ncbi:MAG: serine/threonine protein kinase [Anaerolineae bacterium]|nr:serine/threonine protein kinase [Anaerolineae bacterium]
MSIMDLIGTQLGQYHIIEKIDTGGMADVYKAYQPALDRHVAIKVIASDLDHDPAFLEQFEREAKTLARLEHPNILPIYDSGRYGSTPYLVTQYISEGSLVEQLGKPLPTQEAVRIVCQIADALGYAHAKKIVHRDVKPANVLLTKSGNILLADFGIAQMLQARQETDQGSGTPAYMAPEQRAGKPIDGRADIYALGVILYELLTGRRAGEQNLLTRSLSAYRHIPAPLRDVINCATVDHPEERYQVVEDFVAAAQAALLKASEEYIEPPKLMHLIMEAVVTAALILAGVGLGVYGVKLFSFFRLGAFMGSAICLIDAALLLFRDRTGPLSSSLVDALLLVVMSGGLLFIPISMLIIPPKYTPEYALPWGVPGMLTLLIAAGLYIRDQRRSSKGRRLLQSESPTSSARHSRIITRQTHKAMIKALIAIFLLAAASRILAYLAQPRSTLSITAIVMEASLIITGALIGVALVIWYAFNRITSAAELAAEPAGVQTLYHVRSNVEARQARLEKAREYQVRTREIITQTAEGPLRDYLEATTRRMSDWVARLENLTARLNALEQDPIFRRDLSTVPRAVDRLEVRLASYEDTGSGTKDAVQQTLVARYAQLHYLRALERVTTQAELQSDETIAALGAIYSQLLLVNARDIQSGRSQRLEADIDEQVQALSDLLEAITEVQQHRQGVSS